ncbi:uncharacterized protein LOC105692647 [Athalia rosae]|uniref:uncharacterized protein LOC105692647 n=1 Tax=Athalia rosae TaxID=37344 RepID=UPI000625CEA3|nr:uncharacterized protein LOC105692647 [Athalia rosae]XP_012267395.1 uncharacterized protein LOC105692647 [Athalia rosae]
MASTFLVIGTILLGTTTWNTVNGQTCSREEHQRCVSLADPLLKDPHLIFPDNMQDIDLVCRTWASFVDCIRRYIENCFTEQRREQFNLAVEMPIASVHQMCSVSTYQAEYLQHATCIKATVTEAEHCGGQYAALVDEVSRGQVARNSLCCSHHRFRSCVIAEARLRCDAGQGEGPAARFSRQVLDKALRFLQDQCHNYIPNSGDCPALTTENMLSVSPLGDVHHGQPGTLGTRSRPYHRTATPELISGQATSVHDTNSNTVYPNGFRSTGRSLNPSPAPNTERTDSWTPSTWMSSINVNQNSVSLNNNALPSRIGGDMEGEEVAQVETTQPNYNNNQHEGEQAVVVTQRPSTYGRGMSWTSPATEPPPEIPAWATSTWLVSNQIPVTDETWYPAAGSYGGNHIDEPNQQGLSKNDQARLENKFVAMVCMIIIAYVI